MTGLIEIVALGFMGLVAITWLAVVLIGSQASEEPPRPCGERSLAARAWLYAPLWVPSVLIIGALLPGIAGLLGAFADHCTAHAGLHDPLHHHHLCLVHPPYAAHYSMSALVPLAFLLLLGAKFIGGVKNALHERALARTLFETSRPSPDLDGVRLLDDDAPIALTLGWRAPKVLLSTGLLRAVSPATLAVILAHEGAHKRRRDPLKAFFDRIAAQLLPGFISRPLLARINLAREQACDEDAARAVGSPVQVARALTEVARLRMAPVTAGMSVASSSLEARILHMLEPAPPSTGLKRSLAFFIIGLAVLGAYPVHAAIEYFITVLLH